MRKSLKATIEKIISHFEERAHDSAFYSYASDSTTAKNYPNVIYLCLTNVCNHRCYVCGYHYSMHRSSGNQGFMSFELVKKIIAELPNKPIRLYLIKQGEPLLHPQFAEITRYIKENRSAIEIAIHTNATKLTREVAECICNYSDFFTVSMFATNDETYKTTHQRPDFEQVVQNIKIFSKIYRTSKKKPKIYFDYVRQKRNQHESDKQVFNFFAKLAPEFNVGIHYPFNFCGLGPEGNLEIYNKLEQAYFPACTFPWLAFTILWDGKVSYCFVEPEENYFMGDVNKDKLLDIWNNSKYQRFRRAHARHTFSTLESDAIRCRTCSWLWSLRNIYGNDNLFILTAREADDYMEKINYDFSLMSSGDEYLAYGLYMLLKGRLGKAMEAFIVSKTVTRQLEVAEKAMFWTDLIANYFRKFEKLEIWEEYLNREGKSLKEIHNTRYRRALSIIPD